MGKKKKKTHFLWIYLTVEFNDECWLNPPLITKRKNFTDSSSKVLGKNKKKQTFLLRWLRQCWLNPGYRLGLAPPPTPPARFRQLLEQCSCDLSWSCHGPVSFFLAIARIITRRHSCVSYVPSRAQDSFIAWCTARHDGQNRHVCALISFQILEIEVFCDWYLFSDPSISYSQPFQKPELE